MPSAPVTIFIPPSVGTPPAAGGVFVAPSVGTPPAVGAVFAAPSAAPSVPGAVHVVPSVGGGGGSLIIGGTTSPSISGQLLPVAVPASFVYPGRNQWTTTGSATAPGSGIWASLYEGYLVAPVSATVDQIAPKAGYVATGSYSTASRIVTNNATFTDPKFYWLYTDGVTARWTEFSDPILADLGGTVIPAGTLIFPITRLPQKTLIGGLGATWETAATWFYVLSAHNNGPQVGAWTAAGASPSGLAFAQFSGTVTGTPTVTIPGSLLSPPSITSAPTASPSNPPAVTL
jgi:hypothetical protein